jgi:hypothetical protein
MAKKVQRKKTFGSRNVSCANCGKGLKSGFETSNFFRFWTKCFCSLKCAKAKGYEESTNIFYRMHKIIMGK